MCSRACRAGATVGEAVVHVLAVRSRMREPFQTFLALERLLSAVKSLVLRQVVLVFERLGAHVALVRSLTCHHSNITR